MHEPALFLYLNHPSGLIFSCHAPDKSLELEVCQVLLHRLWSFARCCVSSVTVLSPGSRHSFAPGQVQQLPCPLWSGHPGRNRMATWISASLLTLPSVLHLGLALMGVVLCARQLLALLSLLLEKSVRNSNQLPRTIRNGLGQARQLLFGFLVINGRSLHLLAAHSG